VCLVEFVWAAVGVIASVIAIVEAVAKWGPMLLELLKNWMRKSEEGSEPDPSDPSGFKPPSVAHFAYNPALADVRPLAPTA
jgi:hypothetical protein